MSEEQLKAFIAKAKDDQSIQEQLKAAKTPDDVIGIAKEHGHEFATEHMTQLSKEELEDVAGGVDPLELEQVIKELIALQRSAGDGERRLAERMRRYP